MTDRRDRSGTFGAHTPLMVWHAAPDGAATYLNPAWLRFTGRSLAQELGQGWLESVHEDDRGACVSECRQAFDSRRGFSLRFRVRRADGVFRAVVSIGAPRFDAEGNLEGFEGTCVDITEQVNADGYLPLTDDRLRLHAEHTAEAVYRIRLQPTRALEYVSASVYRLTGCSPEEYYELYRRPELAKELLVPEDQPKALALMAHPDAAPPVVVLRWKHADGRTIWIEHQRTAIRDASGALVAIVGVARDITRQKILERQERDQAALLFTLVAHLDATLVEAPDGHTILSNPAFARLFGVRGAEDAGTGAGREPSPDSARTRQIRERAEPCSGRVPWPDGRVFQRDYVPVLTDGVLIAHMWRYVDVTHAVRSEKAWHESKERLRELAAHAEAARETERRQLARMLHDDLGQAFTSIRLDLVSAIARFRETMIPEQMPVVDRLQSAAGLVDVSIATLCRVSASLRPPVLDHLGLVAGLEWEAAAFEARTGIRCRMTALPRDFELDRDRSTAIFRIALEALNNVTRHSRAGAVRIALLRRDGVILLKVEDNGRGIRPEEATNPRTMGLLGMRERALPFGGDVRVSGAPRGGTRILVILPL